MLFLREARRDRTPSDLVDGAISVHDHDPLDGSVIDLRSGAVEREAVDVSVLVPTRNESGNVAALTERLAAVMTDTGISWELLFLDDSDDETPGAVAELRARHPQVELLHRKPGQRAGGLAGAVVAGFGAARGRVMVVMDGDMQHPPEVARELAMAVLSGNCDVAIASRYVAGASSAGLSGTRRRVASRACSALVHTVVPTTRGVRDPMSGFFAVSRRALADVHLRPHGFKILMEVLARGRAERVVELPFRMAPRAEGASKAAPREAIRFLRHVARLAWPDRSRLALAARWMALQAPLVAILAAQASLSLRLIYRNSAFIDEGTYISAGHFLLHAWVHGGPNMHFATYFSGAPALYPLLAGLVDNVGGLHAVRLLSLAFMLTATLLSYSTGRRLFGRPAGWLAAAAFVTTQGTQFLGAFATYDAMSLMLTALAAWVVVRCAPSAATSAAIYLAVPVLVLANATKYASAIFDPVVLGMAFFVLLGYHGRRTAARITGMLFGGVAAAIALLLAIGGPDYVTGILWTTLQRRPSTAPPPVVLHQSAGWVGAIAALAALAMLAAMVLAWRRRSAWPTVGLLAVLTIAVLLAPVNQARIHTATSLSKHVTFGAWFGAIGVGWLFHKIVGRRARDVWRYALPAAALIPLANVGTAQARSEFAGWPNSAPLVAALRPLTATQGGRVLVDNAEVPRYYLQHQLSLPQWQDTFYLAYHPPGSTQRLVGLPAYSAAVRDGRYKVIAIDFAQQQIWTDRAIAHAVHENKAYKLVGKVTLHARYGADTFIIWRYEPGAA